LALAIEKENNNRPFPDNTGALAFWGADLTKFIEGYQSVSSGTSTNTAAVYIIGTFLYYFSRTIQQTINTIN